MAMNDKGYLDPLLSNVAVDYAQGMNKGLVARSLFTPIEVDREDSKYPFFGKENYTVPEDSINDFEGEARRSDLSGELKSIHCIPHALKEGIDVRKNRQMDGPFKTKERDAVKRLVYKLMIQEERRAAAVVGAHANHLDLAADGAGDTNLWSGTGGDPFAVADAARASLWMDPNVLLLSRDVFLALKHNPVVLAKLGANEAKIVTTQTLADLFEVSQVLIASAQWAGSRKRGDKAVTMSRVWSKLAAFAYVTTEDQMPTAGKIFLEKAPGMDAAGFLARTWHDSGRGVEGTDMVQVSLVSKEEIVAPDCLYVVKSAIA